jgi:hypothetical protein
MTQVTLGQKASVNGTRFKKACFKETSFKKTPFKKAWFRNSFQRPARTAFRAPPLSVPPLRLQRACKVFERTSKATTRVA